MVDMNLFHILVNVAISLIVIIGLVFFGAGLLSVIPIKDNKHNYILLSPALGIAVMSILLAYVVIAGIPLGVTRSYFWAAIIFFIVIGVIKIRSLILEPVILKIFIFAGIITLIFIQGYIKFGIFDYLGSPALDGWSYVGFGEYLSRYPKGTEGNLSPIFQYASHLSSTRFIASALLAVLVPPFSSGFDAQTSVGIFVIIAIFSYSLAVANVVIVMVGLEIRHSVYISMIFSTLGGWVPFALHVNNYDNLLALSFCPAIFCLMLINRQAEERSILLPSIFMAAAIFIYPELSPLTIGLVLIVIVEQYLRESNRRFFLIWAVSIVMLTFFILSPYVSDAIYFFYNQLSSTTQMSGRPGEGILPSLLDPISNMGLVFGLSHLKKFSNLFAVVILIICFFGILVIGNKKRYSLAVFFLSISVIFLFMIYQKKYDYGGYKILLSGWWVLSVIFGIGSGYLFDCISSQSLYRRYLYKISFLILFTVIISDWTLRLHSWIKSYPNTQILGLRQIKNNLSSIDNPVLVSISDPFLNAWMVYYLRDIKAIFTEFHGYMDQVHTRPLMDRSGKFDINDAAFLLTDLQIVNGGILNLSKINPSNFLNYKFKVQNGLESRDGKPFFWVGKDLASIEIFSTGPKNASINLEVFLGPAIPIELRNFPIVEFSCQEKKFNFLISKAVSRNEFVCPLNIGLNKVNISVRYEGDSLPNSNGDPRTLFVGIRVNEIRPSSSLENME